MPKLLPSTTMNTSGDRILIDPAAWREIASRAPVVEYWRTTLSAKHLAAERGCTNEEAADQMAAHTAKLEASSIKDAMNTAVAEMEAEIREEFQRLAGSSSDLN